MGCRIMHIIRMEGIYHHEDYWGTADLEKTPYLPWSDGKATLNTGECGSVLHLPKQPLSSVFLFTDSCDGINMGQSGPLGV